MIADADLLDKPALRKVLLLLQDTLATAPQLEGITILIDRSFEEPVTELERPAVAIRIVDVAREDRDQNTTYHRCAIDMDICTSDTEANSIASAQSEIEASLVEVLMADYRLGGRIQFIRPRSLSGNEENGAEAGIAISTWEAMFLTPFANFRILITAAGHLH